MDARGQSAAIKKLGLIEIRLGPAAQLRGMGLDAGNLWGDEGVCGKGAYGKEDVGFQDGGLVVNNGATDGRG